MEPFDNTPLVCPSTVTVRRNPHRSARPTPSTTAPRKLPFSPSIQNEPISSFPIQDILSIEVPASAARKPRKLSSSENLKVYLRIRPLTISTKLTGKQHAGGKGKNVWPKNRKAKNEPKPKVKESECVCVAAAKDSSSVTVTPPESLPESKRVKTEVYEGFSHVFSDEVSQSEVYEKMVYSLVEDFLNGKSGMLAALGPSGSGKTHTVFGSVRDPGMVPLALRHIFSREEGRENRLKGVFSLSMFEIRSEKEKSERLLDLLHEGSELQMQQSGIKGLDEVIINDVLEAESLIACGMLRRATAATNSNSQSSRSQCIINICYSTQKGNGEDNEQEKAFFTIVDLAGAEREKKTGNQGLRMVESNFINNTSMVFGLCLRSLLEHQKNQRKPLQKHFQNSLLTRYLRDYLEGKKRMALILTVKPGEDDYSETSNLLKQAAPYAQIKYANPEETGNQKCAKRPIQNFPNVDNGKRMKYSASEKTKKAIGSHGDQADQPQKQTDVKADKDVQLKVLVAEGEDPLSSKVNNGSLIKVDPIDLAKREREHLVMANFNRALWAVLKEYKGKLEIAQNEILYLRDDLTREKKRSSQLEFQLKDSSRDRESDEVSIPSTSAACIGTDTSKEQLKKKQENSCVPESLAGKSGESKGLQIVDIYLDNGATVSIASQIDAKNILEEAGIDNARSEIGRTGCLEFVDTREACSSSEEKEATISDAIILASAICSSSEEKEATISDAIILASAICSPTEEKDLAILDATALNYAVCSPSVEKESALSVSDVMFPDSFACSPTAERESAVSVVANPDSPACFHLAEKKSAIFDASVLNYDVCSPSFEKESALSVYGVIVPDSFVSSSSAEMESAISAAFNPDSASCLSSAKKDSAFSEVIVPDSAACSSSAEKESSVSDVILSNSPTCILSTEKKSAVSHIIIPHSDDCSPTAEKKFPMSDAILSGSATCFLLTEKESADSYLPSAQKELSMSGVIVSESSAIPEVVLLDSPACSSTAEIKSATPDVLLLDSPACYPSAVKESEIVIVNVPDSPASSCLLPVGDSGNASPVKMDQVPHEKSKKKVNPGKPGNDALLTEHSSPAASQTKQKPRRRLQPVSTNLLKNVENLAAAGEINLHRGLKGGKSIGIDTRNRSRGDTSLLRLLREDLFR